MVVSAFKALGGLIGAGAGAAFHGARAGSTLISPRGLGPRSIGVGLSAGGYVAGQHWLNTQEGQLRSYHGDEKYESQFAGGVDTARGLVTAGALYGGVSSAMGGPLGLTRLIKGGIGAVGGAVGGIRSVRQGYGQASQAFGRWRTAQKSAVARNKEARSIVGSGSVFDSYAHRARSAEKLVTQRAQRYERATSSGFGGALHGAIANMGSIRLRRSASPVASKVASAPGKRHSMYPRQHPGPGPAASRMRMANPWNWSNRAIGGAALGVVGAGAAGGYAHGSNQTHFPMLEARNISMATPATQKLNYSTVGLTQALHDRRGRRF